MVSFITLHHVLELIGELKYITGTQQLVNPHRPRGQRHVGSGYDRLLCQK